MLAKCSSTEQHPSHDAVFLWHGFCSKCFTSNLSGTALSLERKKLGLGFLRFSVAEPGFRPMHSGSRATTADRTPHA